MLGLCLSPSPALYTPTLLGHVGPGQQKKKSNTPLMRVWLQSEKGTVCAFMDINTSESAKVKHKGHSLRHKHAYRPHLYSRG